MKLVSTTGVLWKKYGMQKAVDLLIDAGFDALDFSFPDEGHKLLPTDKEYYINLRKYVEDRGVCFKQSHAPAPSSSMDEAESEKLFDTIVSTMQRAAYLGVPHIVVHPCQHLLYVENGNPERLFEYNLKFFRRLIPYCEEYAIKVAIENMWQYPGMISHSTCSKAEEFVRYVDELNSDSIGACLDIGHAMLVREMPNDMIRALGKKRLLCLHVHDVDGVKDLHTLPYLGITDWTKVMEALADIDYKGDFTYEADGLIKGKPDELIIHYLKLMEKTGRYLIGLYDEYKK